MDKTADGIIDTITQLRQRSQCLAAIPQSEVVAALAALADCWRDPTYSLRLEAEKWLEPFPFKMVQVSLDALLDSLQPAALWALIDSEEVRDAQGYAIIGHVIAGNTPLLAWVSMIRALLVRSASFVKLPSGSAARWGEIFRRSLADVSPELAACLHLAQWPGGTQEWDAALCNNADLLMAHGSDQTLRALRTHCPRETPFIGYGHRVSFGLVPTGNATLEAAAGFAQDVLIYDQGGCLSPQTIFVEGGQADANSFAAMLADMMLKMAACYPLPIRSERAAMAVREARALASMGEGNYVWQDTDLRWTVIARPQTSIVPSPTYGVVSVQPLESLSTLPEAVAPVAGCLQGCALAGEAADYVPSVSWLCAPGELQSPPLGWRQDGRDVLRILLPPSPYRAGGRMTMRVSVGSVSEEIVSVGES